MINLIGIFDSGKGAHFVADRLSKLIPGRKYLVQTDEKNAPYGLKTSEQITKLTKEAIKQLVDKDCNPIVIACNTVTTSSIKLIREHYPSVEFIGFEPMIKPAVEQSKNRSIMVLATPATLRSSRYQYLKRTFAQNCKIIEPDCSEWAKMIDSGNEKYINLEIISNQIKSNDCDAVVLACTHYIKLIDRLQSIDPGINILEPTEFIANRIISLGY